MLSTYSSSYNILPVLNNAGEMWEEERGQRIRERKDSQLQSSLFPKEAHGRVGQELDGTFLLFKDNPSILLKVPFKGLKYSHSRSVTKRG